MTVTANIHEAKTTLSKLIERAMTGEEVVIAKAGKPLVRLVAVEQPDVRAQRLALFGAFEGKIIVDEDWEQSEFDDEQLRRFLGDDEPTLSNVAEPDVKFDDR